MRSTEPTVIADPPGDGMRARLVDAAATCLLRLGLNKTSVKAVAAEAGVARASVYRYFDSGDALFIAVLLREVSVFMSDAQARLTEGGSFSERLEASLVYGMLEMPTNPWMKMLFDAGVSPANAALLSSQLAEPLRSYMRPVLETAIRQGEMRPSLDPDEVTDWIVRQMLMLGVDGPWDEDDLRHRLQNFVLPVLIPDSDLTPRSAADRRRATRLAAIETHLDAVATNVNALKSDP